MGRPRKITNEETADDVEVKAEADPLIKTVAEVEKMSREEQSKFRADGGTVISNPN